MLLAGGGNKAKQQLDLGVPPVNARNLNVQSVMAESSANMIDAGSGGLNAGGMGGVGGGHGGPQQPTQVNLRKTFGGGQGQG